MGFRYYQGPFDTGLIILITARRNICKVDSAVTFCCVTAD